jgi:hypothetical protein
MNKFDLDDCVLEALKISKGSASIPTICKYVWNNYISKMESKDDFFYTWGYDIRWAGQRLRDKGLIYTKTRGVWALQE